MPWDVDLSQGRNWGGFGLAYFDDTMYPNNPLYMGRNNRLISASTRYAGLSRDVPAARAYADRPVRQTARHAVRPSCRWRRASTSWSQLMVGRCGTGQSACIARRGDRPASERSSRPPRSSRTSTPVRAASFSTDTQVEPDNTTLRDHLGRGRRDRRSLFRADQQQSGQQLDASWISTTPAGPQGLTGFGFEKSPPGYNDLLRHRSGERHERQDVRLPADSVSAGFTR